MYKFFTLLLCFTISSNTVAQIRPGKYSHLARFSGFWNVESIYNDTAIRDLIEKDFKIDLKKFGQTKENAFEQIDVVKGSMLISSNLREDPCTSSTFMSISLTDDDTTYLVMMRDRKIKIFHTSYGQVTQNNKSLKLSKETNLAIKKMINVCKLKKDQNI